MKLFKVLIVLIILIFSTYIGSKSYFILDLTVGNTLNGIYTSYVYTEKGVTKTKDALTSFKNTATSLKSKVFDDDSEAEYYKKEREAEVAIKAVNKEEREKEIKYTRIVIDIIPILLALLISWKIFFILINPIINNDSLIRKIINWVNGKK